MLQCSIFIIQSLLTGELNSVVGHATWVYWHSFTAESR